MSNDFYNPSSWPATGAPGQSAPARAELASIAAGFAKLPTLTANANKAVVINSLGTAMTVTAAAMALAVAFTTAGSGAITLTSTGATNVTLPTTGTLSTLAGSEELTNKTLNASVGKGTWTASGTWTLPAVTLGGAITYGGVTLSNSVTGTGSMVLSASPTFTGAMTAGATSVTTLTASDTILLQKSGTGSSLIEAYNSTSGTEAISLANGSAGAVYGIPASETGVGSRSNHPFNIVFNSTQMMRFTSGNISAGSNAFQMGVLTAGATSVTTLAASGNVSLTTGNSVLDIGSTTLTQANYGLINVGGTNGGMVKFASGTTQRGEMCGNTGGISLDTKVAATNIDSYINGVLVTRLSSTGLAVAGALTTTSSALSAYTWDSWTPTDVSGTATNAPATGASDDSVFTSAANSSGTVTLTFDVAGRYMITLTGQTAQAITYTFDRMIFNLGGTATRRSLTNQPAMSGNSANSSNFSISTSFIVIATAGQTLTVLPTYELTGAGSTAQHVAHASVSAAYLGG